MRASLPSGVTVEQSVVVPENEVENCAINLNKFSPHESQQWAYLSQPIEAPGKRTLSDKTYEGAWMRLWYRNITNTADPSWEVVPIPVYEPSQANWEQDGVTYRFKTPSKGLYTIQVGGPKIPWKMVAIPSTYEVMLLVRPSPIVGASHPLEVIESGGNWVMEAMLTLLQRGDLPSAKGLDKQLNFTDGLLDSNTESFDAAVVAGYFLLRVRDMERLQSWVSQLANRFEWMADGAVIQAWQIILSLTEKNTERSRPLEQARNRLLDAVGRGFPIYTEGLRLLREGLLYFDRRAERKDKRIEQALIAVSNYTTAIDWTATTTSFTGKRPDAPDYKSGKGTPREKETLIYVFDVPVREVLKRASVDVNEKLVTSISAGERTSTVNHRGEIEFDDGSTFKSLGAAQNYLTGGASRGALGTWRAATVSQDLGDVATKLRTYPSIDKP